MSREFNGTSDVVDFSAGGAVAITNAAMSLGILWKPLTSHRGGYFDGRNSGEARHLGINPFDNGSVFFARNGGASINYDAYLNQWAQLWWTVSSGGTIRTHLYRYDTGLWAHTDAGTAGSRDPLAHFLVGSFDGGQWLHARAGLLAAKPAELTDSDLENSGCVTGLAGWLALNPTMLLSFKQTLAANPVVDVAAGGTATQLSSTNPAISGDEPAGFSYALGIDGALSALLPAPGGAALTGQIQIRAAAAATLPPPAAAAMIGTVTARAALAGQIPNPTAALTGHLDIPPPIGDPAVTHTRPETVLYRRPQVGAVATRTDTLVYRRS